VYDAPELIERIREASAAKGVSANKALIESNAGKDLITNIRKNQCPTARKFADLANYLECSVDYLLGRTDNPEVNK